MCPNQSAQRRSNVTQHTSFSEEVRPGIKQSDRAIPAWLAVVVDVVVVADGVIVIVVIVVSVTVFVVAFVDVVVGAGVVVVGTGLWTCVVVGHCMLKCMQHSTRMVSDFGKRQVYSLATWSAAG